MESQRTVTAWADQTFGEPASLFRLGTRAHKELTELLDVAETRPGNVPDEAADVAIILLRIASRLGVTMDLGGQVLHSDRSLVCLAGRVSEQVGILLGGLSGRGRGYCETPIRNAIGALDMMCQATGSSLQVAVTRKMAVNRSRTWVCDGTGVGQHR